MDRKIISAFFILLVTLFYSVFSVASESGWVTINGKITTQDGTPLCAMVLANGQHMFTGDPAGQYKLCVPLDDNGQITLFGFCDGLLPFKTVIDASETEFDIRMPTYVNEADWRGKLAVVEQDGVEYRLQTDSLRYNKDYKTNVVKIRYRVTNKSDETKEFGNVPNCYYHELSIVRDAEDIWNNCRIIPPCGFIPFRLEPGESWESIAIWDMTNDNRTFETEDDVTVSPSYGTYYITSELRLSGNIEVGRVPVSVSIEVTDSSIY